MKTAILIATMCTVLASPILAMITSIDVDPAEPVVGQAVTVTVAGFLPNSCWSLLGHTCTEIDGLEVVITVDTYDCLDRECFYCLGITSPLEVACTYEFSMPGMYTIRAVENRDSLYPLTWPDMTLDLEVTDVVATDPVTWAAIKNMYR